MRFASLLDVLTPLACRIETLTGEKISSDVTLQAALKSGVLLCKAVNAIKANTIKKINTLESPFKHMVGGACLANLLHRISINASRGMP